MNSRPKCFKQAYAHGSFLFFFLRACPCSISQLVSPIYFPLIHQNLIFSSVTQGITDYIISMLLNHKNIKANVTKLACLSCICTLLPSPTEKQTYDMETRKISLPCFSHHVFLKATFLIIALKIILSLLEQQLSFRHKPV